MANQYFGKYRAKVVDVKDPENRGRVRVMCPKVLGEAKSAWCEPCVPVAYDSGGDFAIPKLNEFVWVEFEEGNSNKPIYTGGLWSTNKSPSNPYETAERHITWGKCKIKMSKGNVVTVSTGDSSVTLTGGATTVKAGGSSVQVTGDSVVITVGGSTITVDGGSIKLSSAKIDLN